MKINGYGILTAIHDIWPECYVKRTDYTYWQPKKREVDDLLLGAFFERYHYLTEVFDCDDVAKVVHAFVIQERYIEIMAGKPKDEWFSWPFGDISLTRFQNRSTNHMVNFCLTRDVGLVLVDARTGVIKEADSYEDSAYFAFM